MVGLWPAVVAIHHRLALDQELSLHLRGAEGPSLRVHRHHAAAGQRAAYVTVLPSPVTHAHDSPVLGHAVLLDEPGGTAPLGQEGIDPPFQFRREHISPAPGHLQEEEVCLRRPGILQEKLPVGCGAADLLWPVTAQHFAQVMGTEHGTENHPHPQRERGVEALTQAKHGKEREEYQGKAPSAILRLCSGIVLQRPSKGPPGEHHTFGRPRGAPGVGDGHRLFPPVCLRRHLGRGAEKVRPGQAVRTCPLLPGVEMELSLQFRGHVGSQGQHHEVLGRGLSPVMVDLGKGHLQHQGHPGTCLGEVLLHLGRAHLHIHPVGHRTDSVNGVKGHHCLGGVEGEQGHQFSRPHP